MKLRDHPNLVDGWLPQPGGAFDASYLAPLEQRDVLDEVLLQHAVGSGHPCIALRAVYLGNPHTRDLFVRNGDFAEKLFTLLRQQRGEILVRIGDLEVDL
jgi:hypothetical protein